MIEKELLVKYYPDYNCSNCNEIHKVGGIFYHLHKKYKKSINYYYCFLCDMSFKYSTNMELDNLMTYHRNLHNLKGGLKNGKM